MSTMTKTRAQTCQYVPDYITLLPPGNILSEKLFEMGLDATGLAERSGLSVEIIQCVLKVEIPVNQAIAEKLERATWIPAASWLRYEEHYRKDLEYSKQHPEIPVY